MSNFSFHVFEVSLVFSLVVGFLSGMLLRGATRLRWLVPYCVIATLVHLMWLAWPVIPSAATEFARWAFAIWLGFIVVAMGLFPLFALACIIARVKGKPLGYAPTMYACICLICAVALCVGGASPRIREETVLMIALSHHPQFFPAAASRGAQLTLSSHTHGGQVAAFGRPLIDVYEYMSERYEANNKHLDVSAGFGHWLPLRLGVPREVVVVTLRKAMTIAEATADAKALIPGLKGGAQ